MVKKMSSWDRAKRLIIKEHRSEYRGYLEFYKQLLGFKPYGQTTHEEYMRLHNQISHRAAMAVVNRHRERFTYLRLTLKEEKK